MSEMFDELRSRDPKVHVLLAEKASSNTNNGTVSVLGAGYHVVAPTQTPMGPMVAMTIITFLELPLELCNRDIELNLDLVDDDGRPVFVPSGEGESQPFRVSQTIRAVPVPGAPTGSPGYTNIVLEINAPGHPVSPGHWYFWRASIEGIDRPEWQSGFWVPAH